MATKCLVCGKPYTRQHVLQKYCSEKCRRRMEWNRDIKERLEKRNKVKLGRNCSECKKIFYPDYEHKFAKFCSQLCRNRYYRKNNRDKVNIYKRNYYKRDKYHDWKVRYDRQYKDEVRFGGNRKKAMKRDDFSCQKCGAEYPYARLVVHHVNGDKGYNELVNLQVLCRACHALVHKNF